MDGRVWQVEKERLVLMFPKKTNRFLGVAFYDLLLIVGQDTLQNCFVSH